MCVSVLPLPLLFVATVTARRHHYHTFDVHCFSFHFGTLSTISAAAGDAAESEYKKNMKIKRKQQMRAVIRVFARIGWLMFIVTAQM